MLKLLIENEENIIQIEKLSMNENIKTENETENELTTKRIEKLHIFEILKTEDMIDIEKNIMLNDLYIFENL